MHRHSEKTRALQENPFFRRGQSLVLELMRSLEFSRMKTLAKSVLERATPDDISIMYGWKNLGARPEILPYLEEPGNSFRIFGPSELLSNIPTKERIALLEYAFNRAMRDLADKKQQGADADAVIRMSEMIREDYTQATNSDEASKQDSGKASSHAEYL